MCNVTQCQKIKQAEVIENKNKKQCCISRKHGFIKNKVDYMTLSAVILLISTVYSKKPKNFKIARRKSLVVVKLKPADD